MKMKIPMTDEDVRIWLRLRHGRELWETWPSAAAKAAWADAFLMQSLEAKKAETARLLRKWQSEGRQLRKWQVHGRHPL